MFVRACAFCVTSPPFFSRQVRNLLEQQFSGHMDLPCWSPIIWPPRSLDLKPIDLLLRGHIVGNVYATEVQDHENFISSILFPPTHVRGRPRQHVDVVRDCIRRRCETCVREEVIFSGSCK